MATGQYLLWKDAQGQDFRPVALTGTDLLNDRNLNKGTAFTDTERDKLGLRGLRVVVRHCVGSQRAPGGFERTGQLHRAGVVGQVLQLQAAHQHQAAAVAEVGGGQCVFQRTAQRRHRVGCAGVQRGVLHDAPSRSQAAGLFDARGAGGHGVNRP